MPPIRSQEDLDDLRDRDEIDAETYDYLLSRMAQPDVESQGTLRLMSQWLVRDHNPPPLGAVARYRYGHKLDLGLAAVSIRNRLGQVAYDPTRDALSAAAPRLRAELPLYYLTWQTAWSRLTIGTYKIGFAERLTFDNTGQPQPDGAATTLSLARPLEAVPACKQSQGELDQAPCSRVQGHDKTPDFTWQTPLRGAALDLDVPVAAANTLKLSLFASQQVRSVYQYAVFDRKLCDDPRQDEVQCDAPPVYVRLADLDAPTATWTSSTLPKLVDQSLGGARLGYLWSQGLEVGALGWAAGDRFRPQGIDLDFQAWDRYPAGGPYGAIGLYGRQSGDKLRSGWEVARSFDNDLGHSDEAGGKPGGGWGAVARLETLGEAQSFLLALRHFDTAYNNPYARPKAAPDEFEGQRARDELGGEFGYLRYFGSARLLATLDHWWRPSTWTAKLRAKARLDGSFSEDKWQPTLGLEFEHRERRYSAQPGVQWQPNSQCRLALRYRHDWVQEPTQSPGFRQDLSAWQDATVQVAANVALSLRLRYRLDNVLVNTDRAHEFSGKSGAAIDLSPRWQIALFHMLRTTFGDLEHWLGLDMSARF